MKKEICPSCGGSLRDETIGWRCKKCRGFISMQDGKFYEYVEKPFMPPQTNADRIRAMSDEELKDFLCGVAKCESCESCRWATDWLCSLEEWLRQPAEMPEEE